MIFQPDKAIHKIYKCVAEVGWEASNRPREHNDLCRAIALEGTFMRNLQCLARCLTRILRFPHCLRGAALSEPISLILPVGPHLLNARNEAVQLPY